MSVSAAPAPALNTFVHHPHEPSLKSLDGPHLPPTPPEDKPHTLAPAHHAAPSTLTSAEAALHGTTTTTGPELQQLDWREIAQRKQAERERLLSAPLPCAPADGSLGSSGNLGSLGSSSTWVPARATHLVDPSVLNVLHIRDHVLSPRDVYLTDQTATSLAQLIRDRQASAREVTTAFIRAAVVAQDLTNCLTEICFEAALQRAAELDAYQSAHHGQTVGPLHGVPVSVKDHINIQGMDGASGFAGWAYGKVADKDAVIVRCMRLAGAVIYCKTSNPQSLLAIETNNNIYGRTVNPSNRTLAAGGSTGGEGALIAMRGSPLGIGTDIAGSIRIPALWNGIYGLKPSVGRLPHTGLQGPHDGMDAIMGCVGPMARSLQDLELFCSAVLSEHIAPWRLEHQTMRIPWRRPSVSHHPATETETETQNGTQRKLTIAVMREDGMVLPHPPVLAALDRAVRQLRASGHHVVEWTPLRTQEAHDVLFTMLLQDRGQEYLDHLALSGEPAVPLIDWLLRTKAPPRALTEPKELWDLVRQREKLRQDGVDQWNDLNHMLGKEVDAILCPGAPTLAPRHDASRHWMYTAIWNVLDWPALTFPVDAVDKDELESAENEWPGHGASGRNDVEREVWAEWSPGRYDGAPVGLQLVGRRLDEEKLLMDMAVMEGVLRGKPASA